MQSTRGLLWKKSWESGLCINVLSYIYSQLSSQDRRDRNLMANKVNINGGSLLHMPTSTENT